VVAIGPSVPQSYAGSTIAASGFPSEPVRALEHLPQPRTLQVLAQVRQLLLEAHKVKSGEFNAGENNDSDDSNGAIWTSISSVIARRPENAQTLIPRIPYGPYRNTEAWECASASGFLSSSD